MLEQGSGKLCTRYLLEQGQRQRRSNSSFDNARTMNCSLNNHDPITKSGFTIQPLQKKTVYFTRSICSAIVWCLWKFLQDHKRSPSSTSTTLVHFFNKKMSVSWSGQVKSRSNKWGDRKSLDKGRGTFEDFELFGYHSCKNLCCELKRFHLIIGWWFYLLLRCYKLADRRLCMTISSLVETTSPRCSAKDFSVMAT